MRHHGFDISQKPGSRRRSINYKILVEEVADYVPESGWENIALCAQVDAEAFFPGQGQSSTDAKGVCSACDVSLDCLVDILDNTEQYGIFGGLSERERTLLRKMIDANIETTEAQEAS